MEATLGIEKSIEARVLRWMLEKAWIAVGTVRAITIMARRQKESYRQSLHSEE